VSSGAFARVLAGPHFQVIRLHHRWLTALAQNMQGRAALLVRVSLSPDQLVGDGRGFIVETERNGTDDYVRISSSELGMPPIFLKLVEYVLERTGDAISEELAVSALIESIEEFRRFSARRSGRLTEEEIRGLLAELIMLRVLVDSGSNIDSVMFSWKGPFAQDGVGIHDFTFADGRGIEVKSTHQPPVEVRVSSPAQLIASEAQLDLVVLPLEDVPVTSDRGIAFRAFMSEIEALVESASIPARQRWGRALEALGLDLADEYYDQWRFEPGTWIRFAVREGFPRIAPSDVARGIVKITYSLDLQSLHPFSEPFSELVQRGVK